MLVGVYGFSQSSDQNYIMSCVYNYNTSNGTDSIKTIQYFDGLGRHIQTVQKAITPTTKDDLVNYIEYDLNSNISVTHLPVPVAGDGNFVGLDNVKSSTYYSDSRPYVKSNYDALGRLTKQTPPGTAWESHPITTSYQTNTGSEVKLFVLSGVRSVTYTGYYPAASLYKTVTADEDGKTTAEYKDKLGRVVMQRQGTNVDTYYVYNDLGQLTIVLPPLAADANGSSDAVNKYAYCYEYDNRGNCISKKLPGCEPVWMAYDKADRMVCSQDGNQRAATNSAGKRSVTLSRYDIFGRPTYTSVLEDEPLLSSAQAFNNNYGSKTRVMITPATTSGSGYSTTGKLLTVNYYDNYNFINLESSSTLRQKLTYQDKGSDYSSQHSSAKGLLTGTRTYLLDNSGSYTTTAYYYDERGNIVQERSTNYLGGYDITYHKLDFTGKPNKTLIEHNVPGVTSNELYKYTYDHAGRLKNATYKIDNADEIVLSALNYDELGRVVQKLRHSGTDTELYKYNIRGWTTEIESGDFHQKLYYEQTPYTLPYSGTPQYNGNISYQTWTYGDKEYGYGHTYDALNRHTSAHAYSLTGGASPNYIGYYENFGYDKQGNITRIFRRTDNNMLIDYAILQYDGNQIKKVNDNKNANTYGVKEYQNLANAEREMFYDANGNLTADLDREIVTIQYNLLNLPKPPSPLGEGLGVRLYNLKTATRYATCTMHPVLSCAV